MTVTVHTPYQLTHVDLNFYCYMPTRRFPHFAWICAPISACQHYSIRWYQDSQYCQFFLCLSADKQLTYPSWRVALHVCVYRQFASQISTNRVKYPIAVVMDQSRTGTRVQPSGGKNSAYITHHVYSQCIQIHSIVPKRNCLVLYRHHSLLYCQSELIQHPAQE